MGRGATTDNLEGEVEQLKQLNESFKPTVILIKKNNNINSYNK